MLGAFCVDHLDTVLMISIFLMDFLTHFTYEIYTVGPLRAHRLPHATATITKYGEVFKTFQKQ